MFIGALNSNTPQQNAGVFIGQTNNGGWDADMKFQAAKTGNFNMMSVNIAYVNIMNDNMEFIDGAINDQDFKPAVEGNL